MTPEDLTQLHRMLEAAQMALSFSQGMSRIDLETQAMYYYAVVKAVELVGEAANQVTTASQSELREIPWHKITGMRNILVHNFHDIDNDILWQTVQDDMPILVADLEVALLMRDG